MSELSVGTLSGLAANGYVIDVASGSQLTQPGMILQVVSTSKTDTFTMSSMTFSDITGLSASITPQFQNSKILAIASVSASTVVDNFGYLQIVKDSTPIFIGDAATSKTSAGAMYYTENNQGVITSISLSHLDSPNTTSLVTYKVQCRTATAGSVYINRSSRDLAGGDFDARTASSITLMEVAA